ncbi:MAG: chlorite dismutase family protein [Actinomycetaceae bacterium]|nr:chlorite dismutase family protein [Actinomycetaceae bacterium]
MDKLQHGAKTPGHGHGGKQTFIPAPDISHDPRDWVVDPEVVNSEDHYSLHMVFKRVSLVPRGESERVAWAKKLQEVVEKTGVEIRGWYDVAGFRSDADLMCWVLADSAEKCQAAFHAVANFGQGGVFEPVWSAMSRHIPAEFNRIHLPACFGGWAPRKYAAVYPFVRSLDWYYLPEARRSAILREHGMNANSYNDVPISTLAAFALGDWEWAITIEGDELERVMGVLRKQRGVEARLFVREDTPFYTGVRMEITQWFEAQPFA